MTTQIPSFCGWQSSREISMIQHWKKSNKTKFRKLKLGRLENKYPMIPSLPSVQNVKLCLQQVEVCWDITDLNMKVSSILVISVIIKLHKKAVFRNTFSQYMKVSSILVLNVIIKLQQRVIFRHIFNPNMKVSSILVLCVIIKLHNNVISSLTWQQNTVTPSWSATIATIRPSGGKIITVTRKFMILHTESLPDRTSVVLRLALDVK